MRPFRLLSLIFTVIAATFLLSWAQEAESVIIDDFSTSQAALTLTFPPAGTTASSSQSGAGIIGNIGTERDLQINLTAGVIAGNTMTSSVSSGFFSYSQDATIQGDGLLQWDGTDGSPTLNPIGLGGVDLTQGGQHDAFLFDVTFDDLPNNVQITVYTNAGNASQISFTAPGLIFSSTPFVIPFSSFTTLLGSGATFANVGAIELRQGSNTTAPDVVLGSIQTTSVLTALKVDSLLVDGNGNGVANPGETLRYTITITNPDDVADIAATSVVFADAAAAHPNTTLVVGSVTTSQGAVTSGNTAGDTAVGVNIGTIADAASVTITFDVLINSPLPPSITQVVNQGTVTSNNGDQPTDDPDLPGPEDPTPTPVAVPIDLGDAPDPTYPTLLASTGASHGLGTGVFLGACVDSETNGLQSAAATGDDTGTGGTVFGTCANNDDEDGVNIPSTLFRGATQTITVTAAAACTLSAFIDYNGDGDWLDTGESLFPAGQVLATGVNVLSITVPLTATAGATFARFRCTTDGLVPSTGQASDGEVEDYQVSLGTALDFGDAPDPSYPTLLANNGARHELGSGVFLGACVDRDADGQPTAGADGDDTTAGSPVFGTCANNDDEDGVSFPNPLFPGTTATVNVTASQACTLSAFIDFNGDGDWGDPGESLFPSGQVLTAGPNSLSFAVPAGATAGSTFSRFRCTTTGVLQPTGSATDGEVEDHVVTVQNTFDFGDAPDATYPTLLANDGARHILGSGVFLGACVDAEANGLQSSLAGGDDSGIGSPVFGACAGNDDEDGVLFTSALNPGVTATLSVTASAACTLSAWIDFNDDGDWSDAGENLFPSGQALTTGANSLSYSVPAGIVASSTFARFRCTTSGVVGVTGQASDGEVEDYPVDITIPPVTAPNLSIVKDDGVTTTTPGSVLVYALTVSNTGTAAAQAVAITETVPMNTTFNSSQSSGGWSCANNAPAGTTCALLIGPLAINATASRNFAVNVDSPIAAGESQIDNTGLVWDPADPMNPPAMDLDQVNAAPDLTIVKDDGGASVTPGGLVTYTLTVTNIGNENAAAVTITETVPTNTTFNSSASSMGWTCSPNGNAGSTCSTLIGALPGGGGSTSTTSRTFAVTLDSSVSNSVTEVNNTATVSDPQDPTPASDPDNTPIFFGPDLAIAKTDGGVSVSPGSTLVYTLTVSNVGVGNASNVRITETVPANTTFNAGASTAGWTCSPNGNAGSTCGFLIGALASGATASPVHFGVVVASSLPAGTQIDNTANVWADPGDQNSANDTDTEPTPSAAAPEGPKPVPALGMLGLLLLGILLFVLASRRMRPIGGGAGNFD